MSPVVLESPYAGDVRRNLAYLRACMADCLARGEAPFASHGLYTQPGVLDDRNPAERAKGINAGFAVASLFRRRVFYTDLGWSSGMRDGHDEAIRLGQAIEYRTIPGWQYRGHTDGLSSLLSLRDRWIFASKRTGCSERAQALRHAAEDLDSWIADGLADLAEEVRRAEPETLAAAGPPGPDPILDLGDEGDAPAPGEERTT